MKGATTAVNFSKYGDYLATGAMDSIVIFWQSNMETTHIYIEEENSFPENGFTNRQINQNSKSSNLGPNYAYNENLKGTDLYSSNKNLNLESKIFSNEDFLEELKKKNTQEKTLNYKNKNFPILNYDEEFDPKEHLAENLSKLFEKMVNQLEMVTRY
jgi:CRISPR/Cas system CMR subunit Cmr4 (Cas7 group RAMP superfamily)